MTNSAVETIQGIDVRPVTLYRPVGSTRGMFQDLGYDCTYRVEPEDTDELAQVQQAFAREVLPVTFPEPIPMWGMGPRLRQVDMPRCQPWAWPVMSTNMLDLLASLGEFPHHAYQTEIFDMDLGNAPTGQQLAAPPKSFDQFIVLHLTEHLQAIDYRRSDYTYYHWSAEGRRVSRPQPSPSETAEFAQMERGEISISASRLVLTLREEELPPVFRLKSWNTSLFLSPKAQKTVEQAQLNNIDYLTETVYVRA